ncbi:MAG: transglutaminase domain-containing protein [Planctomycetes bacterium]|nr:transglutaminase domain-containing protein [Planctomycetota bacterium]
MLGVKKRLLRVEMAPDEIALPKGGFQLPTLTAWLDNQFVPVRSQVEMPPLGKITLYRTTREIALKPGRVAEIVDMGYDQLLPLNRRLPRGYDTRDVVYRITLQGDKNPATAFAQDNRQDITKIDENTIEVHVHDPLGPAAEEKPAPVSEEYLKSCYFINSGDVRVKEHAKEAVGEETDPLRKALRIEQWVHNHMENQNFTEAFATADHVARTLEGDCTEYAVLTAAMCRAAGIPSRAAVGLLYVDMRQGPVRGPVMGFHMWAEVWIDGRWVPIDATLGRGFVGATHLKIADNSWYGIQTLTPLLPVARVLGKMKIEIE